MDDLAMDYKSAYERKLEENEKLKTGLLEVGQKITKYIDAFQLLDEKDFQTHKDAIDVILELWRDQHCSHSEPWRSADNFIRKYKIISEQELPK